jgi:predicted ATP-grasp superfamily ATP-dependent carboligase
MGWRTVRNPDDLVTLLTDRTDYGQPVMLHSLAGFLDAGAAGRLAVGHLLASLPNETVAEFSVDELFDYRARRPAMTFLTDHYGEIDLPELALSSLTDDLGRPFLLLHGPEPDFQWQRFAAAVVGVVRRFEVSLVLGMHAVPFPAPHTRPVGVTTHSTDPSLVAGRASWVGDLQVPGHMAGLLEIVLGNEGLLAMGFAAHVPHYVAQGEYPAAAVTLLESVMAQTGLVLPLDALREAARATDLDLDAQVAASDENAEAVRALEQQYESVVAARSEGVPGQGASGEALPSGDDIAAQVEQFLAQRDAQGRADDEG